MPRRAILTVVVVVAAVVALGGGQAVASSELQVDDDGAQCPDAFTTIQAAVNAAAGIPGTQTIRICQGTYPENVSIGAGNPLEIFGDGTDDTFVTGVAGTAGPIFDVASAGRVTIETLTVDGGSALAGGVVFGIRFHETDGVIEDTAILNIRDASGSSQGIGIRIQSSGAAAKVAVEGSLVQNFTRVGISANGLGVDVQVEDNVVVGPVPPKVWAPNGVQVSRGAVGQVEDNEVHDATSPAPPSGAGSGILLFCAGPTTVEGNRIFGSDLGIALGDNQNARVEGNEVHDSVFDAISLQFIGTLFGPLGCPTFPSPTSGNVVEDNELVNSAENGISLASFDPTDPTPPSDNRFEGNEIAGSGVDGIHVFDGTDNVFEENEIAGSGATDCVDDTSGSGTAGTANTWEDNEGQTSDPPGLCDGEDD